MGLAEAAKACGVSVSTIRRRKDILLSAGARITSTGWQIPIPALVSSGLMGGTTPPPDVSVTPATVSPVGIPDDMVIQELESLRARLVDAERRAAVAEAQAVERERVIQVQATALRMLEAGTPAWVAPATSDSPSDTRVSDPLPSPASGAVLPSQSRARRLWPFTRR
ncbi:hypothetical protein CQ018_19720 [Arthrobacter sp. MYb227]|nr:hypothetical protein CQ018_19720 [Arthrobacter sp. MYb227]